MQRYFIDDADVHVGGSVTVNGDDAHHIRRVMRMQSGDMIQIVAEGRAFRARLEDVKSDAVIARVLDEMAVSTETVLSLTLLQGLPKGDKIDVILRHACEIGAQRIVVFAGKRSVVELSEAKQEARLTRWRKMVKESAEQAHRERIPEVTWAASWTASLQGLPTGTALIVPYEDQGSGLIDLRSALSRVRSDAGALSLAIGIGPEGGFDEAEIAAARAYGGCVVTLGPRILRTETAGIVTAAAIMYEFGELSGKEMS